MSRRSEKISVFISFVFIFLLFFAFCFALFWLPDVVTSMIDTKDNFGNRGEITTLGRRLVLADAYTIIAVAFVALALLFYLLRVVQKGQVFSSVTVSLLSGISWCCFVEGILSLLLVVYFQLAFGVAVAAGFLGLCLRIVRHVIEEATRLKDENEYTI